MKIVMYPKIQVDTAIAYFLLKNFGDEKFPGVADASPAFWTELPEERNNVDELEADGYILVDLGGGKFDHHRLGPDNKKFSVSHLVAQHLGIDTFPELRKLLELARRDDLEGKGTISIDPIDRAFGISGLLSALNKTYSTDPEKILYIILPLIHGHYVQEHQKYQEFPKEYEAALKSGKAKELAATQLGKHLKIVYLESDNPSMPGFLRSKFIGAHMVIQKTSTGHINFITNQTAQLQLHKLARAIKLLEAEASNIILNIDNLAELEKPGRTEGLPHWYYDTRANTLQNGGINPQNIPPTKLSITDIETTVKQSLNLSRQDDKFKKPERRIPGAIYID